MKQTTFASLAFDRKKKPTRREKFLAEMERAVPWSELLAVIEPHYPKAGRRGRQPFPLATMLRLYFLQQWYALSDPGLEDALYEIESMRRFAGLELADDALPSAVPSWQSALLMIVALVLFVRFKWHPAFVLAGGAALAAWGAIPGT